MPLGVHGLTIKISPSPGTARTIAGIESWLRSHRASSKSLDAALNTVTKELAEAVVATAQEYAAESDAPNQLNIMGDYLSSFRAWKEKGVPARRAQWSAGVLKKMHRRSRMHKKRGPEYTGGPNSRVTMIYLANLFEYGGLHIPGGVTGPAQAVAAYPHWRPAAREVQKQATGAVLAAVEAWLDRNPSGEKIRAHVKKTMRRSSRRGR